MAVFATAALSPNVDNTPIDVQYVVLHYTGIDLKTTLRIFGNKKSKVSAHLVIDEGGEVYEVVRCLEGTAFRAWHAGVSRWEGKEGFNDFSIGIELINFNGNVLDYSVAQYLALKQVITTLKEHYPALQSPERIVGHEHIAGFRGKADPGIRFDWPRFFADCYSNETAPTRTAICPAELLTTLEHVKKDAPFDEAQKNNFWQSISLMTESAIKLWQSALHNQ